MGSRPPKGFHLRESNESENTNDKINPNIDKFSRNLLSTPSEAQNLHDPYKGLNTDQRNDKIINDFKQAIKKQVEKFEEIGQQDVTTIDDIEEFNRNKRKVDKTSFDELDKERYKNKFLGDLSKKTPEEIYKEIYSNIENAKNADLSPFIDKTLTLEPKEIEYSIEDNDDITRGQFSDLKTE